MAHDYEVAIRLTMAGNAAAGLTGVSRQIAEINASATKLNKTFDTLRLTMGGAMMERWGKAVVSDLGKAVVAGADFIQIQKQIGVMGASQLDVQKATAEAWRLTAKYSNVAATEIMEMQRDAKQIFGSQAFATEHAEMFTQLASFQKAWSAGHTGTKAVNIPQEVQAAIKSAEIAGATTPAAMQAYIEKFVNARIATGGNVSSQQFLAAQRIAGTAFRGWSDDYKFGGFSAMIQEYGVKAGTMAMTSFSKLAAGNFWSKTNLAEGIKEGLVDPKLVEYDTTGRPMRLKPGENIFARDYASDPLKYYEDRIKPALDRLYGNDFIARTQGLTSLGGNANVARQLNELDLQWKKLEKDRLLPGQVSADKSSVMGGDNFYKQLEAVQTQWKNFVTAMGMPSVATATSAMRGIADALSNLTAAILAHPEFAKNALAVAAGCSAAMTALGALAVGAGIVGLLGGGAIIVGITALTGGLAGLAAANWGTLTKWIDDFGNAVSALTKINWNQQIIDWIKSFGDAISELWGKIQSLNPFHHTSFEGGGFGGGGGITKAAWRGGEGAAGRALSAGEHAQYASMIRQYGGDQAANLLKIYGTEGASSRSSPGFLL